MNKTKTLPQGIHIVCLFLQYVPILNLSYVPGTRLKHWAYNRQQDITVRLSVEPFYCQDETINTMRKGLKVNIIFQKCYEIIWLIFQKRLFNLHESCLICTMKEQAFDSDRMGWKAPSRQLWRRKALSYSGRLPPPRLPGPRPHWSSHRTGGYCAPSLVSLREQPWVSLVS